MRLVRGLVLAATVCAAAACRATKSGDLEELRFTNFLSSYEGLVATGDSDMAAYRWVKPGLDLAGYHAILVDHPIAQMTAESLKAVGDEDLSYVLGLTEKRLREELAERYTLTDKAGPGVLRMRTALSDLESSSAVLSFTRIVPVGIVVSKGKELLTGTAMNVGRVGAEMELVDAVTGERLAAAVDRRVGKGVIRKMFTYWGDVDAALTTWSERTNEFLGRHGMASSVPGAR